VRPLRFCHVTTFYPPYNFGGDGMGIQRLVHGLLARGHECTVIHDADAYAMLSGGKRPALEPAVDGLEVVPLASRMGAASELLTQQLGRPVVHARRIREVLAEGRFDVVNFHNISLVGGPGILAYGDAVKLYMAHEHWLVCPSHVLWRHGRERCDGKECLRCVLSYRRPPQLWRYTGLLERELRHVDAFIAMSEFSRAKHREFGFPRDMEVLPYFLPDPAPGELADGPASERPSDAPKPYFLFVGRLERIKGLDDVLPIFREFEDAELLIAGDGDYADVLRTIGKGIERVRFLGRIDPLELRRYYDHAVALIVPSVCFETFGIILIEAFRQRTPVLARRLGPFPEIVEKAGGGELFETPDELLAAMRRMLVPEHRERLARAGQAAFLEHWTESAVVPRYLDLVRRTADATGRAAVVRALT
jgi:glycosyltransferase involved in cell wall biosynthesis